MSACLANSSSPACLSCLLHTYPSHMALKSTVGRQQVTSTFGAFDLAGFAKPSVWWFKSYWLTGIPNHSADKPFALGEQEHVVKIVESWEEPSTRPLSNGTTLKPCSSDAPGQHIQLTAQQQLRTVDGLCIDGSCANLTT